MLLPVVVSLELRRTGGSTILSPTVSGIRSRALIRASVASGPPTDVSAGLREPFAGRGRFIAGGLSEGWSTPGLGVERNAAGSMEDAVGMKDDKRFGSGRRVPLPFGSTSMGKVVSSAPTGVLAVSPGFWCRLTPKILGSPSCQTVVKAQRHLRRA